MMSKLGLLIVLQCMFIFPAVLAQEINTKVTDTFGNEKLVGEISKTGLTKDSFASWFNRGFENYTVEDTTLKALQSKLEGYQITIFMGTWCGDSKREVPRFYKILEALNFSKEQLTVIAVDNDRKNYKKSPTGEEKGRNIQKVPTFIFYKNGKELNRIIESPVSSLEKDMLNILTSNTYIPNYVNLK